MHTKYGNMFYQYMTMYNAYERYKIPILIALLLVIVISKISARYQQRKLEQLERSIYKARRELVKERAKLEKARIKH